MTSTYNIQFHFSSYQLVIKILTTPHQVSRSFKTRNSSLSNYTNRAGQQHTNNPTNHHSQGGADISKGSNTISSGSRCRRCNSARTVDFTVRYAHVAKERTFESTDLSHAADYSREVRCVENVRLIGFNETALRQELEKCKRVVQ